ncbi:MAG: orotate phosphoribosyltransferase [Eubacteriales bacterium]
MTIKMRTINSNSKIWERLYRLVKERSFEHGKFILSSGKESTYYFDGKQVTLHPEGAYLIGILITEKIKSLNIDAVGGLTIGADPIIGALAPVAYLEGLKNLKLFIVRKEAKGHGKCKYIEGPPLIKGDRIVIVDDVITTGGSVFKAIDAVKALGCQVVKVIALIDRMEGGTEKIQERGIEVDPIFTIDHFKK